MFILLLQVFIMLLALIVLFSPLYGWYYSYFSLFYKLKVEGYWLLVAFMKTLYFKYVCFFFSKLSDFCSF
jgi:hypothetical protein